MNATSKSQRVVDPVCRMTIDPEKAAGSSSYGGQTYYFCSRGCEAKFDAGPSRFIVAAMPEASASCCSTGHSCC